MFYGLDRIQNPLSLADSDSDLDSICTMVSGRIQNPLSLTDLDSICTAVWVGFRIQLVNGSRLGFNLFYKSGQIQNPLGLMDLD